MINSITVTNHLQESMTMELMDPYPSGFIILSIDGLGPPKANINMTEMSGLDGSSYNSARAVARNIVLRLRFMMKPDIETIRQKSYKYFPLKKQITLQINADHRTVKAYGYVESNEPDIFSKEEGCVISILCPDSYLFDEFNSVTVFSSVTAEFEFPFSNESLVTPLLEMSSLTFDTTKSVVYTGDAEVGFIIHIHASGSANDIRIIEDDTLDEIWIDSDRLITITGSDVVNGDDIYISTVKGDKYAILVRGSTTYNILNALGQNPTWFTLTKGDNVFAYDADSGLAFLQFEVITETAFEGV